MKSFFHEEVKSTKITHPEILINLEAITLQVLGFQSQLG